MNLTRLWTLALSAGLCSAFMAGRANSDAGQPGPRTADAGASITGVAHIAYYVSDLNKARGYYKDFLGFEQACSLKNPDGSDHAVYIKINDDQYIKLVAEEPKNYGFLHDVAFAAVDADRARSAIEAMGVKVPGGVGKDEAGNLSFGITDPFGYTVEVIQYKSDSMTGRTKGKFMPGNRISTHIDHVGILVGDRARAAKFYSDIFGFVSEGDGSKQKIGAGPDRFEIGFERKPPTAARFHVKNHICLSVPDVPGIADMLRAKASAKNYREIETHSLDNGKHVAELYDPDGNRVELMEPPKANE